jgi:hypothetical protein
MGYQISGSVDLKITQFVTCSGTEKVMTFSIDGVAGFIVGISIFVKKIKQETTWISLA